MPTMPTDTQIRLNNIIACLRVTADTLDILANCLRGTFLEAISNTTRSLLKNIETIKDNKNSCILLMEQTHELLNAIIMLHARSDAGVELPPNTLHQIGKFIETLHKVYTFIEVQQSGSKVQKFFRQGEMSTLLKDCKNGLKQGSDFFQIGAVDIVADITQMQKTLQKRHQQVLSIIEGLSDAPSSDTTSMTSRVYSGTHNSSNSISMLPSEPKIFHGRESELADIIQLFSQGTPRIAILGTGGMGKTSLARAVLHHGEICSKYQQHRFFVACDAATEKAELAALVGAHLGLKPGKDLTRAILQHFSTNPPGVLILDNLETIWEPKESRSGIEEFLSILADVEHLGLIITMRGAERPGKVQWTRPFLPPLGPLDHSAARQTFVDIADEGHIPKEVDQVLSLTDNMPLAINLLAHLVDVEGCSNVLSRWEEEKTSLISEGYDRTSNLNLSISLSLSSPRIKSIPQSQELLSLLSMLPDGLSDAELIQSKLPLDNILACKTALIGTALAYRDDQERLKALVPIRDYMHRTQPPQDYLIQPLLKYFQELFHLFLEFSQLSSPAVAKISSNLANIHNVLSNRLHKHRDLNITIFCTLQLNQFSVLSGQEPIALLDQLYNIVPYSSDHHLKAIFMIELINARHDHPMLNADRLMSEASEYFEQFNDPDLECSLYTALANYYRGHTQDAPTALKFCQRAISLAETCNTRRHSKALAELAWIESSNGNWSAAQKHGREVHRLAHICGDLLLEAQGLQIDGLCWFAFGNYKNSVFVLDRARYLLSLCGMSGGHLDHRIMTSQAEIYKSKSEYKEAYNIHMQILREAPIAHNPTIHAFGLLNLAETSLLIGASKDDVQQKVEKVKKIFQATKQITAVTMCDATLAKLYLREGDTLQARTLFEKCLTLSLEHPKIKSFCLEHLANVSSWGVSNGTALWTTVFLGHSLKYKEKLGIHKAL
ncbi:hypothetical protein K438DRAFT_2018490, partial [Mycena galopus ATCC 62051]